MKPLFTTLFSLFIFCAQAQISDFTTDSCAFAQSLRVKWLNITDQECMEEFNLDSGWNELLNFQLVEINMGPHDADFTLSYHPDFDFDSCHWHPHIPNWNEVQLLNGWHQLVTAHAKIGWNLGDGGNIVEYINSYTGLGACVGVWLNSYYPVDNSLLVHPINDVFDRELHMGMSAGRMDSYSDVWGNHVSLKNVPNGTYYIRKQADYGYYFNQGQNSYPDNFEIVITISGAYPSDRNNPRSVTIGGSFCDASNPGPQTITAIENRNWGTRQITWDSTGACEYTLERILVRGNNQQQSAVFISTQNSFYDWSAVSGYFYKYRIGNTVSNKVRYK